MQVHEVLKMSGLSITSFTFFMQSVSGEPFLLWNGENYELRGVISSAVEDVSADQTVALFYDVNGV